MFLAPIIAPYFSVTSHIIVKYITAYPSQAVLYQCSNPRFFSRQQTKHNLYNNISGIVQVRVSYILVAFLYINNALGLEAGHWSLPPPSAARHISNLYRCILCLCACGASSVHLFSIYDTRASAREFKALRAPPRLHHLLPQPPPLRRHPTTPVTRFPPPLPPVPPLPPSWVQRRLLATR